MYTEPTPFPKAPEVNDKGVNVFADLETYIIRYRTQLQSCNLDKKLIREYSVDQDKDE